MSAGQETPTFDRLNDSLDITVYLADKRGLLLKESVVVFASIAEMQWLKHLSSQFFCHLVDGCSNFSEVV